jgi:3-oxoacyl-[acyl-carrier-protein] synthase-1
MSVGSIGLVGAGARTALGRSLPATAAAVRARIRHASQHPFVSDRRDRRMIVARAEWLSLDMDGALRFASLAANAAKEALAPLRRLDREGRIGVFVGLPEPRPGRPDGLEEAVSAALGKTLGDRLGDMVTLPLGHAASLCAFEMAARAIGRGEVPLCLVGGVDSYLEVETLRWLDATDRLQTSRRPWGFTPGEAAAFCVLASPRWLAAHAIASPISLLAAASSEEAARVRTETVCVGAGLGAALDGALLPLRSTGQRVTRVIGDLNGEPYRADEIGFALTRVADLLVRPGDVLAPAEYWGDVGAASGALFAGLAFESAIRNPEGGHTNLLWASSEGGSRAAAVLHAIAPVRSMEES